MAGEIILCVITFLSMIFTCSSSKVIGVSLERLSLYDPLSDFTCFDSSLTFPFSYVNDNYCDCPDGSDEPGTSACPSGVFHCLNHGYIPKNIPSGYVNDGYCDCCDASDEYNNDNCTNICEELGQEAKRQAEKMSQMINEGNRVRSQMIVAAKKIVQDKQKRLGELENEKTEAVRLKDEAEAAKKEAEAEESAALEVYRAKEEEERALKAQEEQEEDMREAQEHFKSFDNDQNGELSIDELKSHKVFDQNLDGEVTSDDIKYIEDASNGPLTFDSFREIVWPQLKPTIVANRLREGLPALGGTEEPQAEKPAEEIEEEREREGTDEKEVNEIVNEDEEGDEEEDDEDDPKAEFDDPSATAPPEPKYDEKTTSLIQAANEARDNFEKASRVVQDVDREITNLKSFLSKDYGEEDEFVPLEGECFTYSDREYQYKLCPFDQVTQAGKSGGSETRLGSWAGWSEKNYSVMLYDKGQSCWNGPQRSTKVLVSCGLENEVVSASEPSKCEYVLEFKTPAVCRTNEKPKDVHEEL